MNIPKSQKNEVAKEAKLSIFQLESLVVLLDQLIIFRGTLSHENLEVMVQEKISCLEQTGGWLEMLRGKVWADKSRGELERVFVVLGRICGGEV